MFKHIPTINSKQMQSDLLSMFSLLITILEDNLESFLRLEKFILRLVRQ